MFRKLVFLIRNGAISIGVIIAVILAIIVLYAISYGLFALVGYGICWAFDWNFSFKTVFGVWLIVLIVEEILGVFTKQ